MHWVVVMTHVAATHSPLTHANVVAATIADSTAMTIPGTLWIATVTSTKRLMMARFAVEQWVDVVASLAPRTSGTPPPTLEVRHVRWAVPVPPVKVMGTVTTNTIPVATGRVRSRRGASSGNGRGNGSGRAARGNGRQSQTGNGGGNGYVYGNGRVPVSRNGTSRQEMVAIRREAEGSVPPTSITSQCRST